MDSKNTDRTDSSSPSSSASSSHLGNSPSYSGYGAAPFILDDARRLLCRGENGTFYRSLDPVERANRNTPLRFEPIGDMPRGGDTLGQPESQRVVGDREVTTGPGARTRANQPETTSNR